MKNNYRKIIENQLPPDLYISKDIESDILGSSFDKLQHDVDILENEVNPLTAKDKGLEVWEKFFKLSSNSKDDIEVRVARVASELIQFMSDENVIRKDEMEDIIALYADNAYVIEYFAEYLFEIVLEATGEGAKLINVEEIHKLVKKIKPSWLDYILSITYKQRTSEINIGTILLTGEEVTVYPYTPKRISSHGKVYIGTGSNTGVESMTVYPRKEVI